MCIGFFIGCFAASISHWLASFGVPLPKYASATLIEPSNHARLEFAGMLDYAPKVKSQMDRAG
jgi:hypothetical protein